MYNLEIFLKETVKIIKEDLTGFFHCIITIN
jgi:hypothetical protein